MPNFRETIRITDATSTDESPLALKVWAEWPAGHPRCRTLWIPKSQIDDDSEVWQKNQEGDLVISEWIAHQKGII